MIKLPKASLEGNRETSYGQSADLSLVDHFGNWLSARRIRKIAGDTQNLDVADLGCGYSATLSRNLAGKVRTLLLLDMHLDPALSDGPEVRVLEASLPDGLANLGDASLDLIFCNNVIEHLVSPLDTLRECHRLLRPNGRLYVNVPSWRGKYFLELAAFRFGWAPAVEMNDHKMYYDPRDLWPLLVKSGFLPQYVKMRTHKFGLNTYGICTRKEKELS